MVEEISMNAASSRKEESEGSVSIRRGRMDSLVLYEVAEDELDTLVGGGPAPIYFNFFTGCLSILVTLFVTMLTVHIKSPVKHATFISLIVLFVVLTILFFALWLKNRDSTKKVEGRVRARLNDIKDVSADEESVSTAEVNQY
jgi:hypothetical protein